MSNSKPRDLIGDIHRQQRRRVLRRAAIVATLAIALLALGIVLKHLQDRRQRDHVIEAARANFASGTASDLRAAAEQLEAGLEEHPHDAWLSSSLALARAQQLAEFGEATDEVEAAVAALDAEATHDGALAQAMLALDEGRLDDARSALTSASALDDAHSIAPDHEKWVAGMLAIVDPEADRAAAIALLTADQDPDASVSSRRLLAALFMHAGDGHAALDELGRARERSPEHAGMAADEALYNAALRQNLGGVASVAEQLDGFDLSPRDRAHADLARGVVHVRLGEVEEGLARIDTAWEGLPAWDKLSRSLALEVAMEAGAGERAAAWVEVAGLSSEETAIFRAWIRYADGDIMGALADLSDLPQENARVALLQGLALVEQERWSEAGPWLERADKLLPGRVDLEVARARTLLRLGDAAAALRTLEGLAQEEPHAPRAWTGLGEAHVIAAAAAELSPADRKESLRLARHAFEKAVEREPHPCAAQVQLGELANARRMFEPAAAEEALVHFEAAVATGDALPRYRERLVAHLAELGYRARALQMLDELVERPGVNHGTITLALRLAITQALDEGGESPAQLQAWMQLAERAGADPRDLERERARAALLTKDRDELAAATARVEQLLAEQPGDVESRIVQVRLLLAMFEKDRAAAAVRRGLQSATPADQGRLHLEWARIESRAGSRRKASSHARAGWSKLVAADRPPGELIDAAELSVEMYARDKKPKPALAVARELVERVPYHSRAWTIRAGAQLRANEAADARASAEKALALDDQDAEAHDLMGRCQLRFGYKDRAKSSFERAIELAAGTARERDYRDDLARL